MEKKELFHFSMMPYREDIPIYGYCFGGQKKTLAVMGAMRGDEVQQIYICAQLIRNLKDLEAQGAFDEDYGVMVIPCASQFSINVGRRFWPMDNTDLNRMFPGYDKGESTQRISAAVFRALMGYEYGIQLASFYLPGDFLPHVRVMDTGYEDRASGLAFGLPYQMIRKPRPYDTTTLNYNWQIWETKAYSLYSRATVNVDEVSARTITEAILRFMVRKGIIDGKIAPVSDGARTMTIQEDRLRNLITTQAGFLHLLAKPGDHVTAGQPLYQILDPYEATILEETRAPEEGNIFFTRHSQLISSHEIAVRLLQDSVAAGK